MATTNKARSWSITINNPTEADHNRIQLLSSERWFKGWSGQLEKGENGTEHIQGMLKTESVRFAQVKKALPRAHIEAARNEQALAAYVKKEDTRVAELPSIAVFTPRVLSERIAEDIYNKFVDDYGEDATVKWFQDDASRHAGIEAKWEKLNALDWLDKTAQKLIMEGHHCEMYAANPAVRSAYKLYFRAMVIRDVRFSINSRPKTSCSPHDSQGAADECRSEASAEDYGHESCSDCSTASCSGSE